MPDIKSRLGAMNRKLYKVINLGTDENPIQVEIRKPTMGDRVSVIQAGQAAGEINEDGHPQGVSGGLMLLARIAQCVLFDPETGKRLFNPTELQALADSVWLEEIQGDLTSVFLPKEAEIKKD